MIRTLLCLFALTMLCACDRAPAHAPATTAPAPATLELELKPVTPLLPNRPTHFAVDTLGNISWVQETDRGDDTMFVIGEGEIPRATQLSAANVAALLGASGGRGNIQGIAPGAGGEIYFHFSGSLGRKSLAAVGRYLPRTA